MRRLLPVLLWAALAAPAAAADWTTFGFDAARSGANPLEQGLTPTSAPFLRPAWEAQLKGAVNAQPLIAGGVAYAVTELGGVYALDAATGAQRWHRTLPTSRPGGRRGCSRSPEQVFGNTATPVVSRALDRLFVAAGDGRVYALRLEDGRTAAGWPVRVADPAGEHVWGGLTLDRRRLFATVASYCDAPPYQGAIVAIDARRHRRVARWTVAAKPGRVRPFGGGIWGWGGVSVDASDGDVYAATGNSLTASEHAGYSERVVRLSRALRVRSSNRPRLSDKPADADFGSTPMLFRPSGCPPLLTALNKSGELFLYRRDRIARGPVQRVRVASSSPIGQTALLGLTAYDAAARRVYVLSPSDPPGGALHRGLQAFSVTGACRLRAAWQTEADVEALTSPMALAGGIVWFATGATGIVHGVDAATGEVVSTLRPARAIFAAPTVADGRLLFADYDGVLRAYTAGV